MAAVVCVAAWAGTLATSARDSLFGLDFGVFHAGADLAAREGFAAAYDHKRFTDVFTTEYFPGLADTDTVAHFISTPTFGWFARPLTLLPFETSLVVWTGVGLVAAWWACRLLELPSWAPLAVAATPMMAVNVALGQTGAFVLLLFVGLHIAHRDDRPIMAGVLAGLLVLKPPLALGYGLLWLIRGRRHLVEMSVAAIVGFVISVPTLLGGLGPWQEFLAAMESRTELESGWSQQSASVSEFIKLLTPNAPSWFTLVTWAIGVVAAAVWLLVMNRRVGADVEVMSGAAIIATVLASPHLLVYDTVVLVIPVALAYRRGVLTGERVGILAALLCSAIAFGPVLYRAQFSIAERGIGPELVALIGCVVLLASWSRNGGRDVDEERSVPVLADA